MQRRLWKADRINKKSRSECSHSSLEAFSVLSLSSRLLSITSVSQSFLFDFVQTMLMRLIVIVVAFVAIGYTYFAAFYRASAREMKRLGKFLFHNGLLSWMLSVPHSNV